MAFDQRALLAELDRHRGELHAIPGIVQSSVALGGGGDPVIELDYDDRLTEQGRSRALQILSGWPVEFARLPDDFKPVAY